MTYEQMLESVKKRLEKYSTKNELNGCIEWNGCKDKDGYGLLIVSGISEKKRNVRAHRLSYLLNFGEVPDKMFVCHRCDNTSCINPNHLFVGTPADNVADMMSKGRYVSGGKPHYGEDNPKSKLTKKQVDGIRMLKKFKISQKDIANSLGLNRTTIQRIMSNKSWITL
jgi:hypothetical protein